MKNWPWTTINSLIWCFIGIAGGRGTAQQISPHNLWLPWLLGIVGAFGGMGIHDKLSAEYLARKGGKR